MSYGRKHQLRSDQWSGSGGYYLLGGNGTQVFAGKQLPAGAILDRIVPHKGYVGSTATYRKLVWVTPDGRTYEQLQYWTGSGPPPPSDLHFERPGSNSGGSHEDSSGAGGGSSSANSRSPGYFNLASNAFGAPHASAAPGVQAHSTYKAHGYTSSDLPGFADHGRPSHDAYAAIPLVEAAYEALRTEGIAHPAAHLVSRYIKDRFKIDINPRMIQFGAGLAYRGGKQAYDYLLGDGRPPQTPRRFTARTHIYTEAPTSAPKKTPPPDFYEKKPIQHETYKRARAGRHPIGGYSRITGYKRRYHFNVVFNRRKRGSRRFSSYY